MISPGWLDTIKFAAATVGLLVTGVAGYTGLSKDVAMVQVSADEAKKVNEAQQLEINSAHLITARVDERTRLMKEQLDRIEKKVVE